MRLANLRWICVKQLLISNRELYCFEISAHSSARVRVSSPASAPIRDKIRDKVLLSCDKVPWASLVT